MQEDGTPAKCQSMGNGFDAVPRSYFYSFNNHDAILHRGIFMPAFDRMRSGRAIFMPKTRKNKKGEPNERKEKA